MNYAIRSLTDQEGPIVWEMLMYTMQETSIAELVMSDRQKLVRLLSIEPPLHLRRIAPADRTS